MLRIDQCGTALIDFLRSDHMLSAIRRYFPLRFVLSLLRFFFFVSPLIPLC
jgi:hypothetical protein